MSQSQPDRLDRIEATLEIVSQQLDNQVGVNAELRQRTAELTSAVNSLITTANQFQENFMVVVSEIRSLREDNQRILTRIERLENRDS